jgi:O-antigen ligase
VLTASRLALQRGGFGDTNTIHSTWVETVVGTGVAGTALLAGALLVALRRGLNLARRMDVVPLLLLIAIGIRSITGNTIESYRIATLFFLWAILCLKDWIPARDGPARGAGPMWHADGYDQRSMILMDPKEVR